MSRKTFAVGLIVLAAAFLTQRADRAQAQGSPHDQLAQRLGEQIELANVAEPKSDVEWGRAEAVVNAPIEQVAQVLADYSGYAGFFPYFQKSKVLSQRGTDAIVYLEAKVLHGAAVLWSQVRMRAQTQGQTRVVEARMMSGKGNISQLLARWEVTPLADGRRSLVAFQILVDPDLPLPSMAISSELRRGAGQAMRALRRKVSERESLATRPSSTL